MRDRSLLRRVRPFVVLAAVLSVAAACAAPTPSAASIPHADAAPPLNVMTFNVRYANAGDGEDAWDQRKELVYGVIREHAPDVVGLQEALPRQMRELRAAFPGYTFHGQGREGGERGEFAALMVRAERLLVLRAGDFWLSPTPDEVGSRGWDAALPRLCSWAVLRDRASGDSMLVMNAHFDHRGERARENSARVLLDRRARDAELPVIVLGDLNAGEDSAPLKLLRAAGLRDTFRDVHPAATDVGTFHGFRGRAPGAKIDHVLVSDGWVTVAAAILRDQDGGRYPSDHYPVSASLRRR